MTISIVRSDGRTKDLELPSSINADNRYTLNFLNNI